MQTVKIFYTYLWLRQDGTPYYVGKGTGKRAIRKDSPEDLERILIQEHASESDAFIAERFLIAFYGRKCLGTGCLDNKSEGGQGSSLDQRRTIDVRRVLGTGKGMMKRGRKWIAFLSIQGKPVQLGLYATPEEATEARVKAATEYLTKRWWTRRSFPVTIWESLMTPKRARRRTSKPASAKPRKTRESSYLKYLRNYHRANSTSARDPRYAGDCATAGAPAGVNPGSATT